MNKIKNDIHSVTAFAPATCANVAVGFDVLGFAFANIGDEVTLTRREDQKIIIESIHSSESLPLESDKNTASVVLQKLCEKLNCPIGFSIEIQKGIPLCSGMGGSAASAVGALVAFNAFLKTPLSPLELAQTAMLGEVVSSGQAHPDNVVPCIFGGMTLIRSVDPMDVVQLPIPEVVCVLVHPRLQISTQLARKILREFVPLRDYVRQSANLSGFIAALYSNNLSLMKKSMEDFLIEPQRAPLLPGFYKIKEAALQAGALGISFSGSGPSLFAFARNKDEAVMISSAMQEQLKLENIASDAWISGISKEAAHVIRMS